MKTILVGADTSASADLAVQAAADLARVYDASLLVLSVEPVLDPREVFDPEGVPDLAGYLQDVGRRFSDLRIETRQVPGDPATTICEVATEDQADLIVVGNRGIHRRMGWLLGGVPKGVLQAAPCSVLVVDTRSAQ